MDIRNAGGPIRTAHLARVRRYLELAEEGLKEDATESKPKRVTVDTVPASRTVSRNAVRALLATPAPL